MRPHKFRHSLTAESALDLIGNTPLLKLDRAYRGRGRILAKAEFMQPGGSIKDRAAKAILLQAIADHRLSPGMTVVEMTSGNMGAGLAVVCAALGHPLVLTMSAGSSFARTGILKALGAEVILVDQVDGTPGMVTGRDIAAAADVARKIAQDRDGFYVDQFNAPEAIAAHETGTGRELVEQSGGGISAWVSAVGTGCTFVGVAKALKSWNEGIVCAAAEPLGCRPLLGEEVVKPAHVIQGTGYGRVPPHWDPKLMDVSIAVSDDDARLWRHKLATMEGLHVGFSSGANVCAAARLLESGRVPADSAVATVLCDTGWKY